MDIYQIKINELEQKIKEKQEEKEKVEKEKLELLDKIETEKKLMNRMNNYYNILSSKLCTINTDEENMLIENLKRILKIQGHAALVATIVHILANYLLITSFSETPEQISDALSDFPSYYLENMQDFFHIFLPVTIVSVAYLNKDEIKTMIKLRHGKINLEKLEVAIYNYKEKIKCKQKEISYFEGKLQDVERTLKKNQQETLLFQKEQTELTKEKNELYGQLVNKCLEQFIENDLNKIYDQRHSNKKLYKHHNENLTSN